MTNTVAPIPRLIYGTAWKKAQTAPLVASALSAGFRALDTAASHHYSEEGVGAGLRAWLAQNPAHGVPRSGLYIQTKFSPQPSALPIPDQVHGSVASSLKNLAVPKGLFAPGPPPPTTKTTTSTSTASSCTPLPLSYVPSRVRTLGISNVDLDELRALCADAAVQPVVVQNRLNPREAYNTPVRVFCRDRGINFQSFWTLTANPPLVKSAAVGRVAEGAGVSNEVAMYGLVLGLRGVSVLDGTTNEARMKEDLEGVEKVAAWADGDGADVWNESLAAFKSVLGDPEGV
ncbi:NADPH-dependent conjugated polyketone reductase C2 [Colletotrichum spaethianum]|uniref:NADPH-dependent conjugated polyketone reductase C2 n=1 Tax=Colletotrichum spaethianum TaxID=700344 RepID=A0AA37US53_9PEZI|nr:NADPH-dependent conjugated polyketone reductase C2 [Colletotrichum spaethianum]GKT49368.1 NADPH-dependent conjugated polyketone reductase C2 [Colletotrichum spaethianum]